MLYFKEKLEETGNVALKKDPLFWITTGILFYFLGNVFVEALLNYLIKKEINIARSLYKKSYIFSYLLFILIITGFLVIPNKKIIAREENDRDF